MPNRLVFQAVAYLIASASCLFLPREAGAEDAPVFRNGLKSQIYEGRNFNKLVSERIDANIEHMWDWGAPASAAPIDDFSIRWTGYIRAPRNERFRLVFLCNDGVRVTIGGVQILNEWKEGISEYEASVDLTIAPQPITVEYFEAKGTAWLAMQWQPTGAKTPCTVPPEAFFPDEASAKADKIPPDKTGLVAEYFDKTITRKLGTGRVTRAEQNWSEGSAQWGFPPQVGARYSGVLVPPVTGKYQLIGFANNKMRLWIDGKPILDADSARPKKATAFIDLEAHKIYPIRIEYIDLNGSGCYYLHWVPPDETKELSLPPECLFQSKSAVPKQMP